MSNFVYSIGDGDTWRVMGVSFDTDVDAADRVAQDMAAKVGDEVTIHGNVPAYTPRPVQKGDVVSGRIANTLPRGTSIVRTTRDDGVPVKVSSALLRVYNGWVSGVDTADGPGGEINEEARYKVLFLGEPWDGPPSTAHRR